VLASQRLWRETPTVARRFLKNVSFLHCMPVEMGDVGFRSATLAVLRLIAIV